MATNINPDSIPVDNTPLTPTNAYFISHGSSQNPISDLTSSLVSVYTSSGPALEAATTLATSTPAPPRLFTIKKENLIGSHFSVKDHDGEQIAEWKCPMLSMHMGRTTLTFLGREEERGTLEMKPTGFGRKTEAFINDGMTYIWEATPSHHERKTLYKVSESSSQDEDPGEPIIRRTKREVATYVQKAGYSKQGLLVLDGKGVDELIGVLTLCAVLETADSFSGIGL